MIVVLLFSCAKKPEDKYDQLLFDTAYVHSIEVKIADNDWQDLIAHPENKTKYVADVIIDGELIEQVSFSAKGNSSLAMVKATGANDRYSFKINFGKPVKGQKWHGLDKLNLQNCFADATYMKDYISYELFRRMGVPSPLASYVSVKINGQNYGLYLAVEEIDDSFLTRCYQGQGSLYKPEWNEPEMDKERTDEIIDGGSVIVTDVSGADLVYTDDNVESYPDIFENNVTSKDKESEKRVLQALKKLHEQKDLDSAIDTEEVIRYFAVQNYLMNYDGYIGQMLHNYYLYEHQGKLIVLPWDYNLAFGCFPMDGVISHPNDATAVINQGIDSPLVGAKEHERPLWSWIPADEKQLAHYHQVLEQMISEQFDNEEFIREMDRVYELIRPYIEQDPTAFYTVQETDRAYQLLRELSLRRAESIRRQLNGTLSPITAEQDKSEQVDGNGIDLSELGPFKMK